MDKYAEMHTEVVGPKENSENRFPETKVQKAYSEQPRPNPNQARGTMVVNSYLLHLLFLFHNYSGKTETSNIPQVRCAVILSQAGEIKVMRVPSNAPPDLRQKTGKHD